MDFEQYWQLIGGDVHFSDRKAATETLWAQHPDKHNAIIEWLQQHGRYPGRNPYFFILDFQVNKKRRQVMSFTDYYAKYGTTEETDGWKRQFIPEEQKTIYVKE